MSLTDTKIRSLKPSDKPFKVSDSHGLYLLVKLAVHVTGISSTVLRVKNHVLHSVPTQSSPLRRRSQREGIRKMLVLNINPAEQRAAERSSRMPKKVFRNVALAWHKSNKNGQRTPPTVCSPA